MSRLVMPAAGVFAVVIAIVVGLVWRPWASAVPEDAAFVVGDQEVSVTELDQRNESLRALYGVEEPSEESERSTFRRQSAKSMAIGIVLERLADEAEISVPDKEVDATLTSFLKARFDGDREAFLDSLGNVGTSEDQVRDEIRRQLQLRLLLDDVVGEVEISSADLKTAFAERKEELATPEKRRVSNIVVASRADAVRVRRQLDAGADVAALAREVSMDAATRDAGGSLGLVAQDGLVPAVGKAVFATAPGKAYGPAKSQQSWNVGVVTALEPRVPATLDRVRDQLRTTLQAEESTRIWSKWLEDELRASDIEYADEYRPDDPYEVTSSQGSMPTEATTDAPEGAR